jgi:hypothetical protein
MSPRSIIKLFVLGLVVASTGCQATYTSIRRDEDQSYYVTRIKQSPFAAWGTLFRCIPNKDGTQLRCGTIAEP